MGNCCPAFHRPSNKQNSIQNFSCDFYYPIQDLPYPIKKRFLEILPTKELINLRKTNIEFEILSRSRKIIRRLLIASKKYSMSDESQSLETFEKIFQAHSQIDVFYCIEFSSIKHITHRVVSKFSYTFETIKIPCRSMEYKALKYLLHENLRGVYFEGEIIYMDPENEKKELEAKMDELECKRRYRTSSSGFEITTIMSGVFCYYYGWCTALEWEEYYKKKNMNGKKK